MVRICRSKHRTDAKCYGMKQNKINPNQTYYAKTDIVFKFLLLPATFLPGVLPLEKKVSIGLLTFAVVCRGRSRGSRGSGGGRWPAAVAGGGGTPQVSSFPAFSRRKCCGTFGR